VQGRNRADARAAVDAKFNTSPTRSTSGVASCLATAFRLGIYFLLYLCYYLLMSRFGDVIRPANEWFKEENTTGVFLLCDPVTGDPINPDQPQDYFYDNDLQLAGMRELNGPLRHTIIDMWVSSDDTTAEGLDGQDGTNFELSVNHVPAAAYVADGRTFEGEQARLSMAIERGRQPASTGDPRLDRISKAIVAADVPHFYLGIEMPMPDEEPSPLEAVLLAARAEVQRLWAMSDPDVPAAAAAIVSRNLEQWYATFSAGQSLGAFNQELCAGQPNIGGTALSSALIIARPSDLDMIRKLQLSGVETVQFPFDKPPEFDRTALNDAKIMRLGHIPLEML
jgi:hypothetical protein